MPKHPKLHHFFWNSYYTPLIAVVLVAGIILLLPKHKAESTHEVAVDHSAVTITTTDGIKLAATLKTPTKATLAPVVILLHQYGYDRHEWDAYLQKFLDAGFITLSYDMRGFGQSPLKTIPANQQDHLSSLIKDLPAVVAYVKTVPHVNAQRITIVGASVGAGVAYVANGDALGIHRTVLLSPTVIGIAFDGHTITNFLPTGVFGIASTSEQTDLTIFMSKVHDPKQQQIVPQGGHGVDLLKSPGVLESVISWIKQ